MTPLRLSGLLDEQSFATYALAMPQALEKMSERAMPEFAPFAATLAQRLTKLVVANRLAPNQPMWELAVDRFLVFAVDTEGQVSSMPADASS